MELGTTPKAERQGHDLDRLPLSYQWRFNVCLRTTAMQATQDLRTWLSKRKVAGGIIDGHY